MKLFRTTATILFLLVITTILPGCFYKTPVRHIASEISLVVPNQTSQRELISYMGLPNEKKSISETEEEWLYFQVNKSFLRKTPLLGKKFGVEDYDVAIIRIKDNIVTSSQYRSLSEDEFKQLGITASDSN